MAYKLLGHAACPLCGFPHQEIRESDKNNKPYMVCDECGMQLFARQAKSVKALRDKAASTPAAPAKSVDRAPASAPKAADALPPKVREKTIFDWLGGSDDGEGNENE